MKRAIVLIVLMALSLFPAIAAGAQAGGVPHEAGMALESSHGTPAPGELVPVSEDAQKKALVQAIWVLIIFIILLAILYPTAWKGVLAALKGREQRIRQNIADAEAARDKAEKTLAQYNQQLAAAEERVRELLNKAHADAERLASNIRESASKEADATKQKALSDIEDAKKQAITDIHTQTVELSTSIAEKIIRRNLNADDQRELVRASLEQFGSRRN